MAVTPIVLWSLLVVLSTLTQNPAISDSLLLMPMLVATAFEVFAAAVLSIHLRRRVAGRGMDAAAPVTPPAGRQLLALFAGAMVVASMTTPALAVAEAGRYSQPHGEHAAGYVPPADPGDGADPSDLLLPELDAH